VMSTLSLAPLHYRLQVDCADAQQGDRQLLLILTAPAYLLPNVADWRDHCVQIVRGIATGDVRRHLEAKEAQLTVGPSTEV
jgi:hypothetical protein